MRRFAITIACVLALTPFCNAQRIPGSLIDAGTLPPTALTSNFELSRAKLEQVPNVRKAITPFNWRVWDSGQVLPSAAAADDLGIVVGTFGTDAVTVQAGDLGSAGDTTRRALVHVELPDYYDDAQTVTLRVRAGMKTAVADTLCTVDIEAHEVGDDGTAGSDLCTTVAQDINSLTEADDTFTITPSGLVAGDVLEIRISVRCNDAATGTVIPVIYKAALLFDARG